MNNEKILSDNMGGVLSRTIGVAVGGAAAYIALVGALLIYCRQRRHRRKHSPTCTARASGKFRVVFHQI